MTRRMMITSLMLLATILSLLTACARGNAPEVAVAGTVDSVLIAYTSEDGSISGLAPAGWVEVKPGHFLRVPGDDPSLFAQAAFPGASGEEVIAGWQLGESGGVVAGANLQWDLYQGEMRVGDAGVLSSSVALAETGDGVYLMLLVTLAEEYELLRETILLPALQALRPATGAEGRDRVVTTTPPGPAPTPVVMQIRPADGMVMVYVPAGTFSMGNTGVQWRWNGSLGAGDLGLQVYTDESPQHDVYLDAFWIDQTEVTVAMFRVFVEATGYVTTAENEEWGAPYKAGPKDEEWPHVLGANWLQPRGPGSSAVDDHPVVQVSWDDASAYCKWAGGQLPSEAQWEKAARGSDRRTWPWGDRFDGSRGNFCDAQCPVTLPTRTSYDDGYAYAAPVGSFPRGASPYGVLDMAGNVWEWVADWYDEAYYGDSPFENPTGPASGSERAQRGGAWYDNESWVSATVRHATPPQTRCDDLGFRCVVPDAELMAP